MSEHRKSRFNMKNVVIPTSAPWLVEIDGETHVTPSTVCRLLRQLAYPKRKVTKIAKQPVSKPKSKKATSKKKA